VAGLDLSISPQVGILDQNQELMDQEAIINLGLYSDPECTTPITETPNHAPSLSGLVAQGTFLGIAEFPQVIINQAGSAYLRASSPGLESACSTRIDVQAGGYSLPESKFKVSEGTVVAGNSITLTLSITDAFGNPAPSGIADLSSLGFTASHGDGTGEFEGEVQDHGAGEYTINYRGFKTGAVTFRGSIATVPLLISPQVRILPGAPAQLVFTTNPGDGETDTPLSTQPEVMIQDAQGNLVPDSTLAVMISIGANPVSGALAGTTTVAAVNGVAQFTDLSIDVASANYTFIAAAVGLPQAESEFFTVSAGEPNLDSSNRLTFNLAPTGDQIAGGILDPQPQIVALNAQGDSVIPTNESVTLSVFSDSACSVPQSTTPNGKTSIFGATTLNMKDGVVSFKDVSLRLAGVVYLKAVAQGMTSDCTRVSVVPGSMSDHESSLSADKTLVDADGSDAATITVTVRDSFGNPIPGT
jgi:hypothetical protein